MKAKFKSSPDLTLIRRLRAAGCPMPSDGPQERQCDLKVEVTKPELTIAYDGRTGTDYVLAVRITNVSYAHLVVKRFRARLPGIPHLYWFGDPRIYTPEAEFYRFESGRKFPYHDVINYRVGDNGVLEPGKHFDGLLLAYTMFNRLPADYIHGDMAAATIFVIDQFERKHRSEIDISVDRRATMRPLVFNPNREPLFGRAERKIDTNHSENTPETEQVLLSEEAQAKTPKLRDVSRPPAVETTHADESRPSGA